MIKVVQFIHGLNMGGAETLVKNYALGLDKRKIELTVLCLNNLHSPWDDILKENNISVIYVEDYLPTRKKDVFGRAINKIFRYKIIKQLLHDINPDIIHCHLGGLRYIRYARLPRTVGIFYTQHYDVKNLSEDQIKRMKWAMTKHPFQIIALHEEMKNTLNKIFSVENTVVLNNGVYFEKYKNTRSKNDMRKELKIPENSFVIGHVGRFSSEKNHKLLVKIFYEICKQKDNVFLVMVGTGEEISCIRKLLKSYNLQDKYLILENRADIPDILNTLDVYVMPSVSEGLCIAVIEAQISGLPCFVSEAIPEGTYISNLMVKENLSTSPAEWARKILEYRKKDIVYYNKEDWDMNNVVKKLEELYTEMYRTNRKG